jgi:hypothetical protein
MLKRDLTAPNWGTFVVYANISLTFSQMIWLNSECFWIISNSKWMGTTNLEGFRDFVYFGPIVLEAYIRFNNISNGPKHFGFPLKTTFWRTLFDEKREYLNLRTTRRGTISFHWERSKGKYSILMFPNDLLIIQFRWRALGKKWKTIFTSDFLKTIQKE